MKVTSKKETARAGGRSETARLASIPIAGVQGARGVYRTVPVVTTVVRSRSHHPQLPSFANSLRLVSFGNPQTSSPCLAAAMPCNGVFCLHPKATASHVDAAVRETEQRYVKLMTTFHHFHAMGRDGR